jgi:hypothetical protein
LNTTPFLHTQSMIMMYRTELREWARRDDARVLLCFFLAGVVILIQHTLVLVVVLVLCK